MSTPDETLVRGLSVHLNLEPRDGGSLPGIAEVDTVVQSVRTALQGVSFTGWRVTDVHQEGSVTADLPPRVPVVQPPPAGEHWQPQDPDVRREIEVVVRYGHQEPETAYSGEWTPEAAQSVHDMIAALYRPGQNIAEVTVRRPGWAPAPGDGA